MYPAYIAAMPDNLPPWWQDSGMAPADMSQPDEAAAKAPPAASPAAAAPGAALNEGALMPIPPEKLDEMIKALQESLSSTRHVMQHENMEGGDGSEDDDDALTAARKQYNTGHTKQTKKRFMTIADLPQSNDFFLPLSPGPPPDDAIMQTGRRLRDGAHMHAISAPSLGVHRPLYIADCLMPVVCFAIILFIAVVAAVGQFRSMQLKLRTQEAHHAAAQQRKYVMMEAMCHRLLHINPSLAPS